MTVVEIWPGGGWYAEILAPALKENGTLYAAHYSLNPRYGYQRRYFGSFLSKPGNDPDIYRDVLINALGDEDQEKYLAIGESDRMTLKFVKPAE